MTKIDFDICWIEMISDRPADASRFYADLFGWEAGEPEQTPMGPYFSHERGERPGAGIMGKPAPEVQTGWKPYVRVPDLEEALAKAQSLGATVALPPMPIPNGSIIAVVQDPQGGEIGLLQEPAQ